MPSVIERHGVRGRSSPMGQSSGAATRERHWLARGYVNGEGKVDEDAAEEAVRATTPAILGTVPLTSIEKVDEPGKDTIGFVARYELPNAAKASAEQGEGGSVFDYSWSSQTASARITQSLATTVYKPEGKTVPDFAGAILVKGENVEGCDIDVGIWQEEITFYLKPQNVTTTLKGQLFALTGKVNSAPFLYFDVGECRFCGCRSNATNGQNTSITLLFAAAPNEKIPSKDEIPEVTKPGQDFVWTYRRPAVRASTGTDGISYLYQEPVATYVEQVYPRRSFALLEALINGIGTGGYVPPEPGDDEGGFGG
ncbi:MAG TPA: hypothetical protein VF595_00500 [Tepidisphaeraceae bacterium]|jgi:hypothetical protein